MGKLGHLRGGTNKGTPLYKETDIFKQKHNLLLLLFFSLSRSYTHIQLCITHTLYFCPFTLNWEPEFDLRSKVKTLKRMRRKTQTKDGFSQVGASGKQTKKSEKTKTALL